MLADVRSIISEQLGTELEKVGAPITAVHSRAPVHDLGPSSPMWRPCGFIQPPAAVHSWERVFCELLDRRRQPSRLFACRDLLRRCLQRHSRHSASWDSQQHVSVRPRPLGQQYSSAAPLAARLRAQVAPAAKFVDLGADSLDTVSGLASAVAALATCAAIFTRLNRS